jgi:hypothetical protein
LVTDDAIVDISLLLQIELNIIGVVDWFRGSLFKVLGCLFEHPLIFDRGVRGCVLVSLEFI